MKLQQTELKSHISFGFLTCRSDGNSSHLFFAFHNFDPLPSTFVSPFRPVAFVNPVIRRRHSGNHQFECSVPAGNQSDASVRVAASVLCAGDHVSLRAEGQNFLRCCALLHRPADGQVGWVGEFPGNVAGEREVATLWDNLRRRLGGDLEGVGDN